MKIIMPYLPLSKKTSKIPNQKKKLKKEKSQKKKKN